VQPKPGRNPPPVPELYKLPYPVGQRLSRTKVLHRGANQCRHTFASQALSSYVPVEWVARQLGHTDTTMVRKHYGRWIPADTKSMAAIVSQMMGFREQA
jgi:integrase